MANPGAQADIDDNDIVANVKGSIDMLGPSFIKGWLVDDNDPTKTMFLRIFDGENRLAEIPANMPREDLKHWLGENHHHGFEQVIQLPTGISPLRLRFLVKDHVAQLKLPDSWSPVIIQTESVNEETISGWAWNPFDPDGHVRLCVYDGNLEIGFMVANIPRDDLARAGFGAGDHAFSFDVPPERKVKKKNIKIDVVSFNAVVMEPLLAETPLRADKVEASKAPPASAHSSTHVGMSEKTGRGLRAPTSARELAAAFFDEAWYVEQFGGENLGGASPFEHWWTRGRHKGNSAHPLFDPTFYRDELAAIKVTSIENKDLFLDFLYHGAKRRIDPHPCFSMQWYSERYPTRDVANPWQDYVSKNDNQRREPNWLFSSKIVKTLAGNDLRPRESLLALFLRKYANTQISPHPMLDIAFTLRHNTDLAKDTPYISLWKVYRRREMRTHMYFDPNYYEAQALRSDRKTRAFAHYIMSGESKGFSPIGLIHPLWYASHYDVSPEFDSILEEYTAVGEKLYRHPCPGFDPRYYLESNNDVARAGAPPLRHFLASGQREKRKIHRRFSLAWYASRLSEPRSLQALEYWLQTGRYAGDAPHPALVVDKRGSSAESLTRYLSPKAVKSDIVHGLDVALTGERRAAGRLTPEINGQAWLVDQFERAKDDFGALAARSLKLDEPVARLLENFDANAERLYIQRITAEFAAGDFSQPLVSVIIPTRNRVHVLARALKSVLTQTYSHFEIIVVDDGGLDATDKLINNFFDDSRIVYVPIKAIGVSGGRNRGLRAAKGQYIAYLDSDNYWEPRHLEITLKSMMLSNAKAAYSVLRAFNVKNSVKFRGAPFDMPSLQRENYIDMNVYMHHRDIADAGLRFDESLKRCVDWDFILRASVSSPPIFVPIVGCNYVDDHDTLNRITTDELSGDFYKVCQRGIDLTPHLTGDGPSLDCRATIIWPISNDDWKYAEEQLWSVAQYISNGPDELIIVNNSCNDEITAALATLSRMCVKIRVIHLWRTFHVFPAFDLASTLAKSPRLVLWRSDIFFDPAAVDNLIAISADCRAPVLIPTVTDALGKVTSELAIYASASQLLQPVFSGQRDLPLQGLAEGIIPVHSPVVIDCEIFKQLNGFSASFAISFGLADFCMRVLVKDPAATVLRFDARLRAERMLSPNAHEGEFLKELGTLKEAWLGHGNFPVKLPPDFEIVPPKVTRFINRNWTLCKDMSNGAHIRAPRVAKALEFVIRCPAPNTPAKVLWGDYHYAVSMIAALEEFGHRGSIEFREDWSESAVHGDIFFHIRGIIDLKLVTGAFNAVWVISHPEKARHEEMSAMDAVFVAGPALKKQLAQRSGINAHILLQGADSTRFGGEIRTVEDVMGKALFVGSSRLQVRPIVLDAIEANLPVVVHGNDWSGFLPSDVVKSSYIENEVVGNWYGSAAVVLNDHWRTMREYGIISNRVFDVVATGTPVITDHIGGLEPIFGESVRSYRVADELPGLFADLSAKRFHDHARFILAHHSIRNRVEEILRLLGIAKR